MSYARSLSNRESTGGPPKTMVSDCLTPFDLLGLRHVCFRCPGPRLGILKAHSISARVQERLPQCLRPFASAAWRESRRLRRWGQRAGRWTATTPDRLGRWLVASAVNPGASGPGPGFRAGGQKGAVAEALLQYNWLQFTNPAVNGPAVEYVKYLRAGLLGTSTAFSESQKAVPGSGKSDG